MVLGLWGLVLAFLQVVTPGMPSLGFSSPSSRVLGAEVSVTSQPLNSLDTATVQAAVASRAELVPQARLPVAAVVPHHLLAAPLISHLIQNLPPVSTIVLISPDHFQKNPAQVTTTSKDLATVFGTVGVNRELIGQLMVEFGMENDGEVLKGEHGINSITPFIKYFLPHTRIVPLVVKNTISFDQLLSLASLISQACVPGRCLVLASTDFSHYLNPVQAAIKDEATLRLIRAHRLLEIFDLTDANVDSPPALILALEYASLNGAEAVQEVAHTNSAQLIRDPLTPTTSYFTLLFH